MGEVSGSWIEDSGLIARGGLALLIDGSETAQGDTKGKTQVIRGGLGVKFFDVFGKERSFRPINGLLSPLLNVTPG